MGRRPQRLTQFAWRWRDEPVQADVAVQQVRVDVPCDSVADVSDESPPHVAGERVPAGPSLRQHHVHSECWSCRLIVLLLLRGTAVRVPPPVRVLAAGAASPFPFLHSLAVATCVVPRGSSTTRMGALLLWLGSSSFTLFASHLAELLLEGLLPLLGFFTLYQLLDKVVVLGAFLDLPTRSTP